MPPPLKLIISASSLGDHLLRLLGGVSEGCGCMLRFPPVPQAGNVGCGGTHSAVAIAGREVGLVVASLVAGGRGSYESEAPIR